MLTRRTFLLGAAAVPLTVSGYAVAVEPGLRPAVTRYVVTPPDWCYPDTRLRIAIVTDIHACRPWMPIHRIEGIVEATNALEPDVVVLLGDFVEGLNWLYAQPIPMRDWSAPLGALRAPLGVYSVLGNHDWWHDGPRVRTALEAAGLPVLENDAVPLTLPGGERVWLGGLGDQLAFRHSGVDDMDRLIAQIPDDGTPAILLAHEPDAFPKAPERFGLTLSGHTHGGQVSLPIVGRFPAMGSDYGRRYAYGHIVERGRHLVVSAGLGCSGLPVRFRVPPEIVLVEVGGAAV
ncbi:MAG: metallophosphoesterase [Bauldia sp.]|nr:metallophosphoesterase [Bauldia sp.]